ncbi:MAG TPA: hypothetical protein VF636_08390 [Sphingomonas sp.]
MKITRVDQGLAIIVPNDVAASIGLYEGDDFTIRATPDGHMALVRTDDWNNVLAVIKRISKQLPENYRFDRDEANAR